MQRSNGDRRTAGPPGTDLLETSERRMKQAVADGVEFAYEEVGSGEPVVFIHGVLIADAFRPLLHDPVLTAHYRLVSYHRRGYRGSSESRRSLGFAAQAADCARLLERLGLERVHVAGHSFGASVALQLALDAPQLVETLSLLEPGLLVGESAVLYRQGLLQSVERYRQEGAEVAVDEFLRARWPQYRQQLDRTMPGSFEQAVADAAGCFESDLPGGIASQLGEQELRRIRQPALVVLGEGSLALHPRFGETQRLLLEWLPHAEGFRLPGATHLLQLENPSGVADALAAFLRRHPIESFRRRSL
jgi:pimeloyl-ACP methyl ester carboxylesterase